MNKRNLCVVAVIGASLSGGVSVASADTADRLLPRTSQFQLGNGDTIGVKRDAGTKGYRVCMDDTPHAVPLLVKYDGNEAIVEPGECRVIEAQAIRLSSATRLRNGMTLIGRFNGRKADDLDAGMRVAQVARDD